MRNRLWMASGLAAVAVLAAACGSSGGGSGSPSGTPASSPPSSMSSPSSAAGGASQSAMLKTAKTSLGVVLTDAKGFTLYWFAPDTSTASKCTGSCASTWPPVMGSPQPAPAAVLMGKLGTITRPGGGTQATFNGHPLYRYVLDTKPGMTSGEGVGGIWHAVKVGGAASAPSSAPAPSMSSGGGGYGY